MYVHGVCEYELLSFSLCMNEGTWERERADTLIVLDDYW